jgi:hypothetical protein
MFVEKSNVTHLPSFIYPLFYRTKPCVLCSASDLAKISQLNIHPANAALPFFVKMREASSLNQVRHSSVHPFVGGQ